MDKKLYDFMDSLSEKELGSFDAQLEQITRSSYIGQTEKNRILSSAMRKAGFDMKEKRTIKKKRIVGICLAAALMFGGAIGAYAAYSNGIWNGMKWRFSENADEETASALESITNTNGVCVTNTFDDLDIFFEGVVNDSDQMFSVFTVKKKDGSAFESKDGYRYLIGFNENGYKRIGDFSPIYKDNLNYNIELNDDGTLSITVQNTWYIPENSENSYQLGFTNIYSVPEYRSEPENESDKSMNDMNDKCYDLGYTAVSAYYDMINNSGSYVQKDGITYFTADPELEEGNTYAEKYRSARDEYFSQMKDFSIESYEGTVIYQIDSVSANTLVIAADENETGCEIEISPLSIKITGEGSFDDSYKEDDIPKIEIKMKDGSVKIYETSNLSGGSVEQLDSNRNEIVMEDWALNYEPDEPIDVEQIDSIVFDGKSVNVN